MQRNDTVRALGTRRGRTVGVWILLVGALATGIYLSQDGTDGLREPGPWVARTPESGAIGTSGDAAAGVDEGSGRPAISPPAAVRDARASLTGETDWQELVGRQVTMTLPVGRYLNDVAFWTGEGDARLLAVIARDQRDGESRQRGESSAPQVPESGMATISGTVRRVPHAEAMYSWKLTNHDAAVLAERPVYLHVERVSPAEGAVAGTPQS